MEALPDPNVTKAPETGYPEVVLVQISLRLTCSVCVITETGGEVLGGLGDASTSCLDTELPISLDDGGKLPLYVPGV